MTVPDGLTSFLLQRRAIALRSNHTGAPPVRAWDAHVRFQCMGLEGKGAAVNRGDDAYVGTQPKMVRESVAASSRGRVRIHSLRDAAP
jgi:hypothetical protein